MANVFTKKNHKPRTTTLRDFLNANSSNLKWSCPPLPRRARVMSPTRRCNPHPTGLVFQKPYNKDTQTFDIWNPDFVKISQRMPYMINHLQHTNFCSGPALPPLNTSRDRPAIPLDKKTTTRADFQTPTFPRDVRHEVKTSRFGYTPDVAARGIVPNKMPPREYRVVE